MGFLAGLTGGAAQPASPAPQSMTPAVMGFPSVPEGPSQQPQQFQQPKKPHGVGNFLGKLGDALLMASGRAPMYAPMMQAREAQERQQQVGQMLGNVLGRLDPSLRDLVSADPGTGLEIFKLLHPQAGVPPETIRLMQAAGIDPQSSEGKAIIQQHLQGGGASPSTFERELTALGIDPHSDEARELYYGRNSPAGYLLKPPPRGGGTPAAGGDVTATGPNGEKIRLNPSTGQWEPVGGQTATPSGPFQQ